jgi:ATP-dependent DNA helicase RecG
VGHFPGTDRTRIRDTAEIMELPIMASERALVFTGWHLMRGLLSGAGRHVETGSVPPEVVRDAVINEVAHAAWSQRRSPIRVAIYENLIEVDSSGLRRAGVTTDDVRKGLSKLTIVRSPEQAELSSDDGGPPDERERE